MPFEFYLAVAAIWIIPSGIGGMIAAGKGRSFAKWMVLGLFISPILAILIPVFLRPKPSAAMIKKYADMESSESPSGD